jgi:hypothetical protein
MHLLIKLFLALVNQNTITNLDVENAIISLENLGFNTLPFGTILEDDNYEDSEQV